MKLNFIFLLAVLVLFHLKSFPQSISISPKKVKYNRPNIDATDDALNVKTLTVIYPEISGANAKKIESLLSYEKAFDFKFKDEIKASRGIQNLNYKVLFNSKSILSIKLFLNAYTFSDLHNSKFISINTKTAKIIESEEVFINLQGLADKCRKSQLRAINEIKEKYSPEDYGTLFESMNFTVEELKGFTIGRKGITFHYPYRFARTAKMFEPRSDYFFSWEEMKPFIRREGLLAQFIR